MSKRERACLVVSEDGTWHRSASNNGARNMRISHRGRQDRYRPTYFLAKPSGEITLLVICIVCAKELTCLASTEPECA